MTTNIFLCQVVRQRSLPTPSYSSSSSPPSLPTSLMEEARAKTTQLDSFLEGVKKKYRSKSEGRAPEEQEEGGASRRSRAHEPKNSLKVGISKMLTRWKTEVKDDGTSFTLKKGVNIAPINVFGGIRRDQSLDSATRRGLFHKRGAWSPKSPKEWLEVAGREGGEGPLLSPSLRRCCMEYPEEGQVLKEE